MWIILNKQLVTYPYKTCATTPTLLGDYKDLVTGYVSRNQQCNEYINTLTAVTLHNRQPRQVTIHPSLKNTTT